MKDDTRTQQFMRRQFHDEFFKRMRRLGFSQHARGTYFEKTDYGRKGVTVFYNTRFGALQVSASISMKVEEVERLLFEYRRDVESAPLSRPSDFSVCEDLGNIKSGIFRWWNNYDREDCMKCLDEVEQLVISYGIPFLGTIDTPEKLLDGMLVATHQKTKLGHPSFLFERAFILMYLLTKQEVFDTYIPVFQEIVRKTGGLVVDQFDVFLPWIRTQFAQRRKRPE